MIVKFFKSLFCKHDYVFYRNIYGDEIYQANGRSFHRCSKCGKFKVEQELVKEKCPEPLEKSEESEEDEQFWKDHDETKNRWKKECPEFDDFEYQKILDWLAVENKAEIVWEDTFISYKKGVRTEAVNEKLAHWSFFWKFGFIGFMSFKKEEEEKAKKAAAMFVWLWLKKGIPSWFACDFAESYCHKEIHRG